MISSMSIHVRNNYYDEVLKIIHSRDCLIWLAWNITVILCFENVIDLICIKQIASESTKQESRERVQLYNQGPVFNKRKVGRCFS